MKGFFGNRFFHNKWVVPVSALILTLSIGSFALASTGEHKTYSFIPPSATSTTSVTQAAATTSSTLTAFPALQLETVTTAAAAPLTAAELELQQAKENAILDLIGEKMTADDKVTFDELRVVATQQQLALGQAQAALQATKAQMTALIDKYLGVPNGISLGLASGTTSSTISVKNVPE
jgi:hypothetical protein